MRSLYSTIRSLSDSIAPSSGPNAACSSGLSSCTFAGFMFRGLQPRNRSPYDFRHQSTNPRKRFDAKSLEELAASFKTQGILAPLLVRELEESKYEVVRSETTATNPPIPESDLMQRASKNWPPASRRKGFWPLFWYANWRKASTKSSPGHVASERRNWRNSKNFPSA